MGDTRRQMSVEDALNILRDTCSRRETSTGDVIDKLKNWNIPEKDFDTILQSLIDHKFVDDRRYALAYVNDKLKYNHWGRRKIGFMLKAQRLSQEIINMALDSIDEALYNSVLANELEKKAVSLKKKDLAKQQLIRYALQKGFEYELISQVIKQIKI